MIRVVVVALLCVLARTAWAQGEPVLAASQPPRVTDPCPRTSKRGEWVQVPEGGPTRPARPVGATASFIGRRFVVGYPASAGAFDPCRGTWSAAKAPAVTRPTDLPMTVGGARFVPGYEPRESSYHFFANARVVSPSGREVRVSPRGAPSPRTYYALAFDGHRLLVWGGYGRLPGGGYGALADGAALDLSSGRWRPISTVGAPSARYQPVAAWTGSKLVVWGGTAGSPGVEPTLFQDGAVYDPARDVWTKMSPKDAPSPRLKPVVVWTGRAMVVAGGGTSLTPGGARGLDDAYVYDPKANRWSLVQGAPKLNEAQWVRTFVDARGRVLYVDTHYLQSFGILDPRTARFEEVPLPETLRLRSGVGAAWSGARLLLWGGYRQVPGYVNPCDNFHGPGGCNPPSPPFEVFADGWLYAPP